MPAVRADVPKIMAIQIGAKLRERPRAENATASLITSRRSSRPSAGLAISASALAQAAIAAYISMLCGLTVPLIKRTTGVTATARPTAPIRAFGNERTEANAPARSAAHSNADKYRIR